MRRVVCAVIVCAVACVWGGGAQPVFAGQRTESVTFSYFCERNVTCEVGVSSARTVEGKGARRRTHFTVITGLSDGSDSDCWTIVSDLSSSLTYRRADDDEPETITTHSYGDTFTTVLETTINGVVADAQAGHLVSFDCHDTRSCDFSFATNPK